MQARAPVPEDAELLARAEPPLSPLVMFVCTYEAKLDNICQTHEALIRALEPRGAVKALNCNYGHKAQPGYERFLKLPPPPSEPEPPREGGLAPANLRQRKLQGDGTCFNSAIEAIVIPGPEDAPPPAVRDLLAARPDKHYAVKSFPTTGKTQVPGVLSLGLEDGAFNARLWARFLTEAGVGACPDRPVEVIAERPIMQNFKFHLLRRDERIILSLGRLVAHLEAVRDGEPGLCAEERLPYPVREIKHAQDNQNISFKFQVSAAKKVRVNVFYRGKINILGAASLGSAQNIYDYLSGLLRRHWAVFVVIQPLSDLDRAALRRAREAAKAPAADRRAPCPPDLTLAPEAQLADEDLDELLGEAGPAAGPRPARPPLDVAAVLALAASFARGGLDDVPLDEVEGQDVENDDEDPLDDDAE